MTDRKPRKDDDVEVYPADARDLESYRAAQRQLAQMQAPMLVGPTNPDRRLYIATFDGTGNNMFKDDDAHETGIVRLYKQMQADIERRQLPSVAAGYVAGVGTQGDGNSLDLGRGHTAQERAEAMYKMFIEQSKTWLTRDDEAQISIASTGFSRGADTAAYFARLVDERGIQNPDGAVYKRDDDGWITSVRYTKQPLVAPGQVAQAVLLVDPVATGSLKSDDRRLPPSVISGLQVTAEDERRNLFPVSQHLPPGFSERKHFLHVTVGGAHSDVGDTYPLNGLGIRSTNLAVDYLNALSETPFLQKRAEPEGPQRNVVHRSEQHNRFLYRTGEFDENGRRTRDHELAPDDTRENGRPVDRSRKEPMDPTLDGRFEHRAVPILPAPQAAPARAAPPRGALLDDPQNPHHDKYAKLLGTLHDEDQQRGRAPHPASARIAAGLTVDACDRGLERIGFAQLSADGSRMYMTDTANPSSELARTAVGDVTRAAQQSIDNSTEKVTAIDRALAQQRELSAQQQTQSQTETQQREGQALAMRMG